MKLNIMVFLFSWDDWTETVEVRQMHGSAFMTKTDFF